MEAEAFAEEKGVKVFAEEMWEAGLPEPYKDMILPEMVEYLETLQNKEEKARFLCAIYWTGYVIGYYEDDDSDS